MDSRNSNNTIQAATITIPCPEMIDTSVDGVEMRGRQLGRGQFLSTVTRVALGASVLDLGRDNDVLTFTEGAFENRIAILTELSTTGRTKLNGTRFQENEIAICHENQEISIRMGEQSCNWSVFQVDKEKLIEAGTELAQASFATIELPSRINSLLTGELLLLQAALNGADQKATMSLDPKMVEDHLISLFSRAFSWAGKPENTYNAQCLQIAKQLTDYMDAHLDERITILDLCRLSGKSEWTLRRIFQKTYGISPRAYLIVHRLNTVHRKLLYSSVAEVDVTHTAIQHGFLHLGRFSAAYRKHFGEYPSETLVR